MSRADLLYRETCARILREGVWDTDQSVRPRWADGSPAHTVKCFGVVNRYDLQEEFPLMTLRRTYWRSCVEELLWIWQKKSNNVHDLGSHIWDSWADESGSIGKAYGYQLGIKYRFPEGEFDQVDRVLYDLKHNPASRRILTSLYNFADLHEMALYPCAYSMTFHVSGNRLNAILNQRSQDMLTANNWNVVQYAVLVHMLAQVSGLVAGELVHVIADYAGAGAVSRAGIPARSCGHGLLCLHAGQRAGGELPLSSVFSQNSRCHLGGAMDCIVNVTQNWGIGKDGGLLVSISADLRRFRALTTGKTVIYGRKTLLTFPHTRPLPNRENWILSATPGFSVPGAAVFPSLAALQEAMRTRPADSLCLIGGASVYRALLPWCSRVLLTQTCADLPADRFFPALDRLPGWRCTDTGPLQEDGGHCFRYLTYENDAPLPL